jgi:outer membrane immunogenic protein
MRNATFLATRAAVLGCGVAHAAELSLKDTADAAVVVTPNTWTGFYVGVGGGGGAVNHDLKASDTFIEEYETEFTTKAELDGVGGDGGFGTVEVGYDRQIRDNIVIGAFFDFDFDSIGSSASISLSDCCGDSLSHKVSLDLNNMWSVGGRIGYLVNPNTMAYAFGAYTQADFDLPQGLTNGTFSGFSVGGGLETRLRGNWFLKAEYRFTSLDQQTLFDKTFGYCGEECDHIKVTDEPDIHTGRFVISYKFNPFDRDHEPLK